MHEWKSDEHDRTRAMPHIKPVVGHSFGGAVTLQLGKANPGIKTVTYGAPVVSASGGERYREVGDPVAGIDVGAKRSLPSGLNPHSYQRVAVGSHEFATSTTMDGYKNTDQSSSLYR